MSTTLSPKTTKILTLIKQTYDRGHIYSLSKYIYVSRIQSVIAFDWANEAAIKAAILEFNPQNKLTGNFNDLVNTCEDSLNANGRGPITNNKEISHVRKVRNQAQHEARYPTTEELQDCRRYTRDFLTNFVFQVWGIDWNDISLTDIINHNEIKEYLRKAEASAIAREYDHAVIYASVGLNWALSVCQSALYGREESLPEYRYVTHSHTEKTRVQREIADHLKRFFEKFIRSIEKRFDRLGKLSTLATYGLDMDMYMRYLTLAPSISFALAGNPIVYRRSTQYTEGDAHFMIQFCINSISQLESIVGNLHKPFGLQYQSNLKVVELEGRRAG